MVRSIRVAAALNERVGELVRPKQYDSDEELGNVLGELRQLYPEVWSHLDDARAALARRGIVVDAYEVLRVSPEARSGGVLDVELTGSRGMGDWTKEAQLNVAGHEAAKRACRVLGAAVPGVDWAALDRADAEQIAAAGSLTMARWKVVVFTVIIGALAVIGIAGYIYYRIGIKD